MFHAQHVIENRVDAEIFTNDDEHGIELAVSHLIELGHKSIAYLGGPQDTSTGHDRYLAFKRLMQKGGFRSHDELVLNCKAFTEAEGHRGFLSMLDKGRTFTAVVAANDLLAPGCYDEIGNQAARLLLERILDPESRVRTVNLLPDLIVRGSTASPKRT